MQEQIIAALTAAGKPLSPDALIAQFEDREAAQAAIEELMQSSRILLTRKRKLALPEHTGLTPGRVQGHARGFGFFVPQGGGQDAFIPADAMHGAMHGDSVWVRYTDQVSRNGSPEAEIALISKRAYTQIVGTFEGDSRAGGYVVPDDARISTDMLIHRDRTLKANSGDKVVATILDYPDGRRPIMGAIDRRQLPPYKCGISGTQACEPVRYRAY